MVDTRRTDQAYSESEGGVRPFCKTATVACVANPVTFKLVRVE